VRFEALVVEVVMKYTLTCVKGTRIVEGCLFDAIGVAREMNEELRPAFGITIESEDGDIAEMDENGEVDM